MNTYTCMECGQETPLVTGLCEACQKRHTLVEKMFQSFMTSQRGSTKEKHQSSEVKHWENPTKAECDAIGVRIPTWKGELQRFMESLCLTKIRNRRDYFSLLHRASCWRDRTFPNFVLIIATYYFKVEWLVVDWYDQGQKELKKHGKIVQKYRRAGWKRTTYNPYEYLKWAHPGMSIWLTTMEREYGLTRKDLVAQAEAIIMEEGGYPNEEDMV